MKVTFIQPPIQDSYLSKEYYDSVSFMPLNIAYLGAVLEENKHTVNIIDLNIQKKRVLDFKNEDLGSLDCDLVGITNTTASYIESLKLASIINAEYPNMIIVMGGCHVTFTAEQTLKECSSIDIIVRGEAEQTIVQIVDSIQNKTPLHEVPGITYRENNLIKTNPDAPIIKDLDSLPFPARHLLQTDLYSQQAIVASRGCPQKCIFCSAGAMSKGKYRIRSPQNIISELQLLEGLQEIIFYDNTFSGHPNKAMDICKALINAELNISWAAELRADSVSEELLALLSKAGCTAVQFGAESGNEKVLRDIKKHVTVEQVRKAVYLALSHGLEVACSFIIGNPSDTQETIQQTTEFMLELKKAGCHVYPGIVTPYPGTELYELRDKYGITIHDYNWAYYHPSRICFSTRYLTSERIGQLFMDLLLKVRPEILKGSE